MLATRSTARTAAIGGVRLVHATSPAGAVTSETPVDLQKTSVDGHLVPERRRSGILSSFKTGTGGRSSFSGNVVTVFGANGWLGDALINRIAKDGTQMIVPYRCDPYWIRKFKIPCDLGQILFFPFELRDEESIRKAVKYSNVVVNLAGAMHNTGNYSMYDVNVKGAQTIARIAREMGVERMIHVSALNASTKPDAKLIPGGSHFLRSKALGEEAVRDEFPNATIVRPAGIYGEMDKYTYMFMSRGRTLPAVTLTEVVELFQGGYNTYKAPVHKNDVSGGIARLVQDPSWDGQTIEFVGPECYRLRDMVDLMQFIQAGGHGYAREPHEYQRRRFHASTGYTFRTSIRMTAFELFAKFWRMSPWMSAEMLEVYEATSDRLSGVKTLADVMGGAENLNNFNYAIRHWAYYYFWGVDTRQHYNATGAQPKKLPRYTYMTGPDAPRLLSDAEPKKFEWFYQTHSRFEQENVVSQSVT